MRRMKEPRNVLPSLLALVALTTFATLSGAQDSIVDLGTLGGKESFAYDTNERGQIVGWSDTDSGSLHAFLLEEGDMIDLGTLGGEAGLASEINRRGQVAGWSSTEMGLVHALLWEENVLADLGTLGGVWSGAKRPRRASQSPTSPPSTKP
jgi:probable HAF family extracellular repeat protein